MPPLGTALSRPNPTDGQLAEGLRSLIGSGVSIGAREPSPYRSTYAIEKVSVTTDRGSLDLVCKYGPADAQSQGGHLRGPAYEAAVYRHLFPSPHLATPHCYGAFRLDQLTVCLVLWDVPGYRVHHSIYPRGLVWVCRDLARFHRITTHRLPEQHNVFDQAHLTAVVGKLSQTSTVPGRFHSAISTVIDTLARASKTVIHGELYPQNVIIDRTGPVVIDWECAGLGPGVLDLAVLTQGAWDPDLVAECEEVYWQHLAPPDPESARQELAAARVWAAGQLLVHLRHKETDGTQEEIAINSINSHLEGLAR